MRNLLKRSAWSAILAVVGVAAIVTALASTATAQATKSHAASSTSTVTLLSGAGPQSLDPGLDYTTQGSEINWLVYTGLTTYAHASGVAGAKLIPGLATALPVISDGGKTYTVTLRKGSCSPTATRSWRATSSTRSSARSRSRGAAQATFITPVVVGATAYASRQGEDDLRHHDQRRHRQDRDPPDAPYGPFDNVLAFPSLGLIIPTGTPMKVQPTAPPPGVGPYMVTNIARRLLRRRQEP